MSSVCSGNTPPSNSCVCAPEEPCNSAGGPPNKAPSAMPPSTCGCPYSWPKPRPMTKSEGRGGRAGCFGPVAWEAMLDSECVWGWSVFCLFVGCSEVSTSTWGSVAWTAAASWGCEELRKGTTQQLMCDHAKCETGKQNKARRCRTLKICVCCCFTI